jgi:hypothetical protein
MAARRGVRLTPVSNRRVLLIALAVVAIAVGIWLLGFALFSSGGTTPGDGRGTPTTVESTP